MQAAAFQAAPPSLPPSPPTISFDAPWVPITFAILVGILGIGLLTFGQRLFKTVLGLTAFVLAGGSSGYVLVLPALYSMVLCNGGPT